MIKCPDPLNVLRNGSTHLANFDRYVCGSLIDYTHDNVLKSYTATGDWVFVLYTVTVQLMTFLEHIMGSAEHNLVSQECLLTHSCYTYHSPALAVYTPMYIVCVTFIASGITQL